MRAARIYGNKDIRIDSLLEPECGPGNIKIRPAFTGICGSDVHAFYVPDFPWVFKTHPLTGEAPPLIMGHEIAGVVTEVGAGVDPTAVKVGDRVAINPVLSDDTCGACQRGTPNCCRQLGFIGLNGGGGGLSDAMVIDARRAFRLPDSVGTDIGALIEPLAVGWHAVRLYTLISARTRALVIGSGPIGCAVILALRAKGVTDISVSEPSRSRQQMATTLGVNLVLDPSKVSAEDELSKHTLGDGVEVVFDCAGVPASMKLACAAVRSHGEIICPAIWSRPIEFDSNVLLGKEASWRPSMCYTEQDINEVIEALAQGKMEPRPMITRKIRLEDVVTQGFEVLHDAGGEHCKILVDVAQQGQEQ